MTNHSKNTRNFSKKRDSHFHNQTTQPPNLNSNLNANPNQNSQLNSHPIPNSHFFMPTAFTALSRKQNIPAIVKSNVSSNNDSITSDSINTFQENQSNSLNTSSNNNANFLKDPNFVQEHVDNENKNSSFTTNLQRNDLKNLNIQKELPSNSKDSLKPHHLKTSSKGSIDTVALINYYRDDVSEEEPSNLDSAFADVEAALNLRQQQKSNSNSNPSLISNPNSNSNQNLIHNQPSTNSLGTPTIHSNSNYLSTEKNKSIKDYNIASISNKSPLNLDLNLDLSSINRDSPSINHSSLPYLTNPSKDNKFKSDSELYAFIAIQENTQLEAKKIQESMHLSVISDATDSPYDRFGFQKKTTKISLREYNAWWNSYVPFITRRKRKWLSLLRESGLHHSLEEEGKSPIRFPPKSAKVTRYIRKGIPADWRGNAWFWYARGPEVMRKNPNLYDKLWKQGFANPTVNNDLIERDLLRTFPDNVYFQSSNSSNKNTSSTSNPALSNSNNLNNTPGNTLNSNTNLGSGSGSGSSLPFGNGTPNSFSPHTHSREISDTVFPGPADSPMTSSANNTNNNNNTSTASSSQPTTLNESPMISALRRVLLAYSVYVPTTGYCQSLNFLAGLMLLVLEEERAFWLLVIMTQVYLPGMHDEKLEGANIDQGVLMLSIKDALPKVWAKVGISMDGTMLGELGNKKQRKERQLEKERELEKLYHSNKSNLSASQHPQLTNKKSTLTLSLNDNSSSTFNDNNDLKYNNNRNNYNENNDNKSLDSSSNNNNYGNLSEGNENLKSNKIFLKPSKLNRMPSIAGSNSTSGSELNSFFANGTIKFGGKNFGDKSSPTPTNLHDSTYSNGSTNSDNAQFHAQSNSNSNSNSSLNLNYNTSPHKFLWHQPSTDFLCNLPPVTLCTTAWFMCGFIGALPIETVMRVWDCFFYEDSKVFFRIALTILKLGEHGLSLLQDPIDVFQYVQDLPKRQLDANSLIRSCFRRQNGFGHLSQSEIEARRQYVAAIRRREEQIKLVEAGGDINNNNNKVPSNNKNSLITVMETNKNGNSNNGNMTSYTLVDNKNKKADKHFSDYDSGEQVNGIQFPDSHEFRMWDERMYRFQKRIESRNSKAGRLIPRSVSVSLKLNRLKLSDKE